MVVEFTIKFGFIIFRMSNVFLNRVLKNYTRNKTKKIRHYSYKKNMQIYWGKKSFFLLDEIVWKEI